MSKEKFYYFGELQRIIENYGLTTNEIKLYCKIANFKRGFFASTKKAAELMETSQRTIQRSLIKLCEEGLIHFDGYAWRLGEESEEQEYDEEYEATPLVADGDINVVNGDTNDVDRRQSCQKVASQMSHTTSIINTRSISTSKRGSHSQQPEIKLEDLELSDEEKQALSFLEEPDLENPKDWQNSSEHIGLGKRPVKRYPEIMLSYQEMARIHKKFKESKLSASQIDDVLFDVENKIKHRVVMKGVPRHMINAHSYFNDFAIDNAVKSVTTQNWKDNSEAKLNGGAL